MLNKIKSLYSYCGRYLGAMRYAPTKKQMQICLFVFGVFMLTAGLQMDVMAQGTAAALNGQIEDSRIVNSSSALLSAIRGPFGALIMIVAGLFAIVMCAIGTYHIALSLLVLSIGSFILRSIIATFFNIDGRLTNE